MIQSRFKPYEKFANKYVLFQNPNNSIQVGKQVVKAPKYYGGFLKNAELANYAADYLNLSKNNDVHKLFLNKSNINQKKIIKQVLSNIGEENIYTILKKNDQNIINNKGNEYINSKEYLDNLSNIFLKYSYSSQRDSWKKWLKIQRLHRNAKLRNSNRWIKNSGPRLRREIERQIALRTPL